MAISELRLIKNAFEYHPKSDIRLIPKNTRGIYALYQQSADQRSYDLVYVGMARGLKSGIKGRLIAHHRTKGKLWSHFSAFEVWDNIRDSEIEELEGLFRHLYKKDTTANSLNKQKSFKKLGRIRRMTEKQWG